MRALNNGKNIISITDHDSVEGYINLENDLYSVFETLKEDKSYNSRKIINLLKSIRILKGVELITTYNSVVIEVLGYNFDLYTMQEEIKKLKASIKKQPNDLLYEEFLKIIDDNNLEFDKKILEEAYSRILKGNDGNLMQDFFSELILHESNIPFLKYIDESNQEKTTNTLKLFINKHLYNKDSIFYVDMSITRPTYENTIDAIHKAGGVAVLAHPGRYRDKLDIEKHIDNMISIGLDGLEVYYPDHSYEFRKFLLNKVREFNLIASGGSDDHHNSREGKQYQLGQVSVPNIEEMSWISKSIESGLDFVNDSKKIQELLNQFQRYKFCEQEEK